MVDFSSHKVPVFVNINDIVKEPTAQEAGNGSDLIARYNGLTTELENVLNNLSPGSNSSQQVLTNNTNWYVDAVNGNDENDGLTQETAFQSLRKASLVAASYLNPDDYGRAITLMPGNHEGCALQGFIPLYNSQSIHIHGLGDINNVNVTIGGESPVYFGSPGSYYFTDVNFSQSVNGSDCLCVDNAIIGLGGGISFGNAPSNHIKAVNGGIINWSGNYQVTGNAINHVLLDLHSYINYDDRAVTFVGDPNIGVFAKLSKFSIYSINLPVFYGSFVGKRFEADNSSVIDTGSANLDLFPGTIAGTLSKNSYYF